MGDRAKPTPLMIFAAALLALAGTAAEGASPPARAWLRVKAEFDQVGHGLALFDDDAFVAADGAIDANLKTFRSSNQLMPYWTSESRSVKASATAVAALRDALDAAAIGQQPGDCAVAREVVGTGVHRLTWYGRGARRNDIEVRVADPALPSCPADLVQALEAIADFLAAAGAGLRGLGGYR